MRQHLATLIVLAACFLCIPAHAGELEDLFVKSYGNVRDLPRGTGRTRDQYLDRSHGITEIGIEFVGEWSGNYTAIYFADGSARYVGGPSDSLAGTYVGHGNIWAFNRVAHFAAEIGFNDLQSSYNEDALDAGAVYLYAKQNGAPKVVRIYGVAGSPSLWALGAVVDDLKGQVDWTKAEK